MLDRGHCRQRQRVIARCAGRRRREL